MRVRFGPLLTYNKAKRWTAPYRLYFECRLAVLKRMLGVRPWCLGDTTPSWYVICDCGLELLQFSLFRAAMRLYNSLTKTNSYTIKKSYMLSLRASSKQTFSFSINFSLLHTSASCFLYLLFLLFSQL